MLTVLGGLAEFECELIHLRTGEGRKRAKERGVRFGRPRKLTRANHRLVQPVTRAARIRPAGLPRAFAGSVSRLLERLSVGLRPSAQGVARPNLA